MFVLSGSRDVAPFLEITLTIKSFLMPHFVLRAPFPIYSKPVNYEGFSHLIVISRRLELSLNVYILDFIYILL